MFLEEMSTLKQQLRKGPFQFKSLVESQHTVVQTCPIKNRYQEFIFNSKNLNPIQKSIFLWSVAVVCLTVAVNKDVSTLDMWLNLMMLSLNVSSITCVRIMWNYMSVLIYYPSLIFV